MKNIVLVGAGKWGQNYIKTLAGFDVKLMVANRSNWKNLIDENPDGVIIATPPDSHIEIAKYSLSRDIPTMIEKPVCLSSQELEMLEEYNAAVLINHIHLFSQAFQNMKWVVGQIDKIFSLGYGPGPIRDYSSLWDYGCHDIAMILYMAEDVPNAIKIEPIKTLTGELFNIQMFFDEFESESLVGNGGAHPIRKFKIHGDGLVYTYDDKLRPEYHSPPLANALDIFINAIGGQDDNRLGLDLAINVTKILEIGQNNLNKRVSINIAT